METRLWRYSLGVIIGLLMCLSGVRALRCFTCSWSPETKGKDLVDESMVRTKCTPGHFDHRMTPVKDCSTRHAACIKLTTSINNGTLVHIERGCLPMIYRSLKPKSGCYKVPLEQGTSVNCYCDYDLCNSGYFLPPNRWNIAISLAVAIFLTLQWRLLW